MSLTKRIFGIDEPTDEDLNDDCLEILEDY